MAALRMTIFDFDTDNSVCCRKYKLGMIHYHYYIPSINFLLF